MCKKLSLIKYLSGFRICKTVSAICKLGSRILQIGSLSYQTSLFSKSYTTD